MTLRPLLALATLAAIALPTAAYCDDASDLRQTVLEGCELKAWQFALRIDSSGAITTQVSPTLSQEQRTCVTKMMATIRQNAAASQ